MEEKAPYVAPPARRAHAMMLIARFALIGGAIVSALLIFAIVTR